MVQTLLKTKPLQEATSKTNLHPTKKVQTKFLRLQIIKKKKLKSVWPI